jgi:hypothetical protein
MMRLCVLLAALSLAPWLPGEEKKAEAKRNTLTAQEIADGWVLLFDGETTFGWKVEGEAKVENGELVIGGKKATTITSTTAFGRVEVRWTSRAESRKCTVQMHGEEDRLLWGPYESSYLRLGKRFSYNQVPVDKRPFRLGPNRVPIRAGASRTDAVEGPMIVTSEPDSVALSESRTWGEVEPLKAPGPIRFTVPAGVQLALRDIKACPYTLTKLFNGKDLAGWKAYKGDAKRQGSKFAVTREGWLNVKGGPGDLQTEKTFGDFVLQLECISNGKNLNSGVFFRCVPGEYQQGYEAQIHNGWLDRPRTITVEDYDPGAKKALKRKVETRAADFGTGAIYRRQPARRRVAKDGEWFAMTVAARGRRVATWVNGVQQVDWADRRPAGDNPRRGYRAKAGAISLQGHDPTTDLSFRNVRISSLP